VVGYGDGDGRKNTKPIIRDSYDVRIGRALPMNLKEEDGTWVVGGGWMCVFVGWVFGVGCLVRGLSDG